MIVVCQGLTDLSDSWCRALYEGYARHVAVLYLRADPSWSSRGASERRDLRERLVEAASQKRVEEIATATDGLIGVVKLRVGCLVQLAPATKRLAKGVSRADGGNYLYYGVREFGMAAIMNGLCLHGGFKPYGGTFLMFSEYARNALRMAALMQVAPVYVFTHDSIGLGEDGPTHQPVEHLAALRAIPNHLVFRPADAVETAECWQVALESPKAPSTLALTRQNLPAVRTEHVDDNLSRRGAYELAPAEGEAAVTIFATGSEVEIALGARALLQGHGHPTRVVSVPCFELFETQSDGYKQDVLGAAPIRMAIEAGIRQGWDRFIGTDGLFIGMHGFGASGEIADLYKHFGITAEAAAAAAEKLLRKKPH